jgi:hypothetical protein
MHVSVICLVDLPAALLIRRLQSVPHALRPGGDEGARTPDFRLAKAALSQLSYIPEGGPSAIRTQDHSLIRGVL